MIDRDRQRGVLIGLAVGDAMGASIEFQFPGIFEADTNATRPLGHGEPWGQDILRLQAHQLDAPQHADGSGRAREPAFDGLYIERLRRPNRL